MKTRFLRIRQLVPFSYRCFCCFLISCAARPPHRVGLPYMLERAGLDVQQGTVNLFSTPPFCDLKIFLRRDAPCMSDDLSPLSLSSPFCAASYFLNFTDNSQDYIPKFRVPVLETGND